MKLIVIGSNSSGNGYILKGDNESLLIECGVNIKKIKQALNFDIQNVAAIVSHSHGDHACSIKDVMNAGITVYASKETFEAKGIKKHHRAIPLRSNMSYHVNGFRIKPFSVNHDVPCFGFLIFHQECGLVLFLTDTYYCDYVFPGLNNIIVECNHDTQIIDNNGTPSFLRERIIQSHMNLETCKGLLQANDLSAVNNIVLIHLSDNNSDCSRFVKEISELTGKTVYAADKGMTIEFNKNAI